MSENASEHVPTLPLPADLPALRLLPVPVSEPPYDDELEGRAPVPSRPAVPGRPLRRLVPLRLVPDEDDEPAPAVVITATDLPPVRPAAHALVQGLLEVLAGVRPVTQLRRATSAELYDELEARVHAQPRVTGRRPGPGAVRSLHVQERTAVAEVCARVDRDGRATALALRFDATDGQWRCTELAGL